MELKVKELPDYEVAYVRHVGSYLETYRAWSQLGEWAHKHGISAANQSFIGTSLDDPNDVEESVCRYDACVTIPENFSKDDTDGIRYKKLKGGSYALYEYYDTIDKFCIAYETVFGKWLPNSQYDADEKPCLEFCMNDPSADPEGKIKIHLYVPVKAKSQV